MEKEILREMQERIAKNFLDVLILAQVRKGLKSGYDVIAFIHNKFHLLMSSGTVYLNDAEQISPAIPLFFERKNRKSIF